MLFYKSFVSLFAVMALATSVTALATPRGNDPAGTNPAGTGQQDTGKQGTGKQDTGNQSTQPVVPVCKTGIPTCCDSTTPFTSLSADYQAKLPPLDSGLNKDLPVGLNCALPGTQGWYCTPRLSYSI